MVISDKWVKNHFSTLPLIERELIMWGAGLLFSDSEKRMEYDEKRPDIFEYYCRNGAIPFLRGCLEQAGWFGVTFRGRLANGARRTMPQLRISGHPQYITIWYEQYCKLDPIFDPGNLAIPPGMLNYGIYQCEGEKARRIVEILWQRGKCRVGWEANKARVPAVLDFVPHESIRGKKTKRYPRAGEGLSGPLKTKGIQQR